MSALAGGDLALPAQIQWSDIWYISSRVLIIALVVTVIGILVLRQDVRSGPADPEEVGAVAGIRGTFLQVTPQTGGKSAGTHGVAWFPVLEGNRERQPV